MGKRAFVSFSGGKDSTLALHRAKANGFEPVVLLNMMNASSGRSMSHAIPEEALKAQADALGLPLMPVPTSWEAYEGDFLSAIGRMKAEYGVEAGIFGDIDIEGHLKWEQDICQRTGVEAHLPLWGLSRDAAVDMFLEEGFTSVIIVVDTERMPLSYLGKAFDHDTASRLAQDGVDACGERGEFHTLAIGGPCFARTLRVVPSGCSYVGKHCFLQYSLE